MVGWEEERMSYVAFFASALTIHDVIWIVVSFSAVSINHCFLCNVRACMHACIHAWMNAWMDGEEKIWGLACFSLAIYHVIRAQSYQNQFYIYCPYCNQCSPLGLAISLCVICCCQYCLGLRSLHASSWLSSCTQARKKASTKKQVNAKTEPSADSKGLDLGTLTKKDVTFTRDFIRLTDVPHGSSDDLTCQVNLFLGTQWFLVDALPTSI